jgi:hypothetical protein
VSRPSLHGLENAGNIEEVENIDALWLGGVRVDTVFEVEATTSMTEALKRGSNIDPRVPKYLVIPQEREDQLLRKLRSPLFGEHFQQDSWKCLFAEVLDNAFQRQGGKLDVTTLIAKRVAKNPGRHSRPDAQLSLFGGDPASEDMPEVDR